MVIVKVMGGLGNQLQQYAVYRKEELLGREAALDLSWFSQRVQKTQQKPRALELDYFDRLPYRVCTEAEKKALTGGDSLAGRALRRLFPKRVPYLAEAGRMYLPDLFERDDLYLEGYFACEKYYHDILPRLREEIRFPRPQNEQNRRLAEQMSRSASVAVHLRRGDYLEGENAALFGGICTPDYYASCIRYVRERVEGAHFYVFSDDPAYAASQFSGADFTVVDHNRGRDSFYDLYLMSRCRHQICANSTFSFWGARLNAWPEKIMIRPLRHRNNQTCDPALMRQLWEGWTFLPPEPEER